MIAPHWSRDGIRVYCGDALRVLDSLADAGERFDMVATDPPYSSGGAFRGDRMADVKSKYVSSGALAERPVYGGDNRDQRSYLAWCTLWLSCAYDLARPGAIVAVFCDWRQLPTMTDAVQAGGWVWRGVFVWDKTEGSRPRLGGYRSQCEFVVWGSAGPMRDDVAAGCGHTPNGLWRGSSRHGDRVHQAEKPVELMAELLRVVPTHGSVLDPFAGSGSTLVAARNLGLSSVGVEIDPQFCDLIGSRLSQRSIDWKESEVSA